MKRRRPLRRAGGPTRGAPLRRGRGPLFDPAREAALEWVRTVVRRERGCCACCGYPADPHDGRLAGHHVLHAQAIRRHVDGLPDLDDADRVLLLRRLLWDPRNGRGVRRACHAAHHSRKRPFTAAIVTDEARAFAAELGLEWWLDRRYLPAVRAADPRSGPHA